MSPAVDEMDQQIIRATQAGLPLVPRPYRQVAEALGLSEAQVLARIEAMLNTGVIRRIGAVPNHYQLGYRYNAMSVWDVPDEAVDRLGHAVGELPFVSHCYCRPRHLPEWRYNLFAMLHAKEKSDIDRQIQAVAGLLAGHCRAHEVLYSTQILKKTGLRIKE